MQKGDSFILNITFGDNVEIIWTLHLEINNRIKIVVLHNKVEKEKGLMDIDNSVVIAGGRGL